MFPVAFDSEVHFMHFRHEASEKLKVKIAMVNNELMFSLLYLNMWDNLIVKLK